MIIPIIAVGLIIIWLIIIYNLFIRDRNLMKEAWSGIDVQLKRRHNLIPNLVTTVKGYSKHERNLFEDITEKRAKTIQIDNIKEKSTLETDLSGKQFNNRERIISYDSVITINEDGSMDVVEVIKVHCEGVKIKRGIFRDFPTKYEDKYGNNIVIKFEVSEVLSDGGGEDGNCLLEKIC